MVDSNTDLTGARILLVDDTPANLSVLCELLESEGCNISMAPSGPVALNLATQAPPDLILLDVVMPDMDGYEVCRRLKQDATTSEIPVLFITAQDLTESVLTGFEVGGLDYITKPFRAQEVLARVQTHLAVSRLTRQLTEKNRELEQKYRELKEEAAQRQALKGKLSMISEREVERWGLEGFVGQSPTIERIFEQIHLMQESAATSVLITGESGTGKELIARAIHFGSARSEEPFVPVNCAAFPADLVESMLFGHVKGSFTGADADRIGFFQTADGGTLFLDEIGDMPMDLQAKLLRVLEDGEVRRIGETKTTTVDVRVLAATNVDLEKRIRDGSFRQDLYFRLARFTVAAPPLRQRVEDVPLLAQHFLNLFAREMGRDAPPLNPDVVERLLTYSFPGNVRELKNIVERALIESRGGEIRPSHLHFLSEAEGGNATRARGAVSTSEVDAEATASGETAAAALPLNLEQAELLVVKRAIASCNGNISDAARLLGTNRNRIYRALAQDKSGDA